MAIQLTQVLGIAMKMARSKKNTLDKSKSVTRTPKSTAVVPEQDKDPDTHDQTLTAQTIPDPKSDLDNELTREKALKKLQSYVQNVQRELIFKYDDHEGEAVIKIYDAKSSQVIREIPADVVLHANGNLFKTKGILFDDKA